MQNDTNPSAGLYKRRAILSGLSLALGGGAISALGWNPKHPGSASSPSIGQSLNRETFLPHLNSEFKMVSGTRAIPVKLVEISDHRKCGDEHQSFSSFSLVFAGPKGASMESGMHRLNHRNFDGFHLFLSPVGKHDDRVEYQAVFSQRV